MKKAYIVEFSCAVRVVVDVPKDKRNHTPRNDDELASIIAPAAVSALQQKVDVAPTLVEEDIVKMTEDTSEPAYVETYYQPELIKTKDVPPELSSFHVFATEEDLKTFMDRKGYLEAEYEIKSYSEDDIEDPTFVAADGTIMPF